MINKVLSIYILSNVKQVIWLSVFHILANPERVDRSCLFYRRDTNVQLTLYYIYILYYIISLLFVNKQLVDSIFVEYKYVNLYDIYRHNFKRKI